jgi:hypothetical protein
MPDRPLLIHIGYHKTATTWLQTRLFQPEFGYRMLADHTEIFAHVVRPHGLMFDPAAMRALIVDRDTPLPDGHVNVLSSEILSGHPFFGGQLSDVYARRLHEIAPQARILVSIRSQLKILPSVYMQYLFRGGTLPYDAFFAGTSEPGYFGFEPEHFEYHRLIRLYQRLFGVENVHVMTQESLQEDADAACAALADFAGNAGFGGLHDAARRTRGVSYPEYAVPALRCANHLRRSTLNPAPLLPLDRDANLLYPAVGGLLRRKPFSTLFKGRKPLSDYVRRVYAGHFAASNDQLAAIVPHPLDLSRYDRVAA